MDEERKYLIVFPIDKTTSFLEDIISSIYGHVHNSLFELIKIQPDDQSHEKALEEIKNETYSSIIFLGHGTSTSLKGATNEGYKRDVFINSGNSTVFLNKNVILVSCESAEFLKRIAKSGFNEGIGFGDLPTDWNDIQSARENDVNAYKDFTEENLQNFKNSLNEVIKYSLIDYMNNDLSMRELKNHISLRINKRLMKYYLENKKKNKALNECFFNMKMELKLL